jgi:hypothetical protein
MSRMPNYYKVNFMTEYYSYTLKTMKLSSKELNPSIKKLVSNVHFDPLISLCHIHRVKSEVDAM